uniref:Prostamide/prostaglandin F synthase n=1 Tax=Crassostrea virginica TaxID=6565 RepID=A0A8B8E887_CRAVI|nr:prostamide/prostaglandin F synthase-like [Crassostrea virginica]
MELAKIAKSLVRCVTTGEPFCRLSAKQLSTIQPQLAANNVRLIGIGLEEVGVEQFIQGNFFTGELYIDTKKQCYKKLGFKRLNFLSVFPSVLSKSSRDALNKAKQENISGDFRGDVYQNGGTLVIEPGGKVLLLYKQENPSDHINTSEILQVLGINADS